MTKESPSTNLSSSRFLFRDADAVDAMIIPRASSRSGVKDAIVVMVETSYVIDFVNRKVQKPTAIASLCSIVGLA